LLEQGGLERPGRVERALDLLGALAGVLAARDGLEVAHVEGQQQDLDELVRLAVGEAKQAAGGVVEVPPHGRIHGGQPLAARLGLPQLPQVGGLGGGRGEGAEVGGVEGGLVEGRPQQLRAHATDPGVDVTVVGGHAAQLALAPNSAVETSDASSPLSASSRPKSVLSMTERLPVRSRTPPRTSSEASTTGVTPAPSSAFSASSRSAGLTTIFSTCWPAAAARTPFTSFSKTGA